MKRIFRIVCALLTAMLLPGIPVCLTTAASPAVLYVSPNGNDTNDGTKASPLKTPYGAKERLKAIPDDGNTVRVLFHAGDYVLTEPLVFTAEDRNNVSFEAFGNGDVSFTGAVPVTGFAEGTLRGVRVFQKRLEPDDPKSFYSLFDENGLLPTPRYPESGYLTVKALCPGDDRWTEDETPWEFTRGQRSFYGESGALPGLSDPTAVQVRILHYWHDELAFLTAYDKESGKLTMSRGSSMLIREGDRFYLENVKEGLSEPGQWYLDRGENTLYYVPRDGETAKDLTLYAGVTEQLVTAEGIRGLSFRSIRFENTDWRLPVHEGEDWMAGYGMDFPQAGVDVTGVVSVRNAENVSLTNCEFLALGGTAVKFLEGVRHAAVENCVFREIAAAGVFAGGVNGTPGEAGVTGDVKIVNNLISGYGRKFFCAVGVHITFCDGAEVRNNEITDGYYTAVSVGWNWGYTHHLTNHVEVRDNLIYNIGQGWLSDMGGIYTLGIQPGTVLSGNVIHNVRADPGEQGYGGWGIYLDEGTSEIVVEKNLVYACGSNSFNIHYARDNVVRNNIFALSPDGVMSVGTKTKQEGLTARVYRNIILTDGGSPVYTNMEKVGHFKEHDNLFWDLTLGENVFFETGWGSGRLPLSTAKRRGFVHHETTKDPLFADAASFDFTLSPDSPAFGLGFEAWDYSGAGTVKGTTIGFDVPGGKTPYNADSVSTLSAPEGDPCPFCGKVHTGFFAKLTSFFHNLFYRLKTLFS